MDAPGYVCQFVTRKILTAHMAWRGTPGFDWGAMSISMLQDCCPDQSGQLASVPSWWSAADLSRCLFGRSDWALLASMAACLWKEPLDAWPRHEQELAAAVRSPAFRNSVAECHAQGCTPCPLVAVQKVPRTKDML